MTHRPTAEQSAIIQFIDENPQLSLMVSARAGAAKTSTIVMAAEKITQSALAVAFNKRNAEDLKEKLPPNILASTLNSVGHRAWGARLSKRMTLDADKLYRLTGELLPKDSDDFAPVLAVARKAKSVGLIPDDVKGLHAPSIWPDTQDSWEELAWQVGVTEVSGAMILQARQVIAKSIQEAFDGLIDFDDQIYMSVLFGGVFPKYHTVIVDESQDLSHLNHRMLKKLIGTRLIAIGDPHQAIYAFRGADANSMENMAEACGVEFRQLKLTASFRAPQSVAERQREWVKDFQAFHANPEGTIEDWPQDAAHRYPNTGWGLENIPEKGFIICRNNAPLMSLAFALIKARRPVKILGRDIGASLASLLQKIAGRGRDSERLSVDDALVKVLAWEQKELAKVRGKETKEDIIRDKRECLEVLLEASGKATVGEAAQFIRDLFSDKGGDLVLMSGHRSKGLEAEWVMHLDPHRIPSIQAEKAVHNGNYGPMIQEMNLKYVVETRTLHTLVLASLEDCEDLG